MAARMLARAVIAIVCLLVAAGPAAAPAAAATTFGRPGATAEYGVSLTFTVEITADPAPARVDLELWLPGALGPRLIPIEPPAAGRRTLTHTWSIGEDGHLAPNTVVRSRWTAHARDGAVTRSGFVSITYADTRFNWRTLEGDIVRVHWYEGGTAFGRRALAIGEQAVEETSALLGVEETEPIDFFIYATMDDFREALSPGTRENVGGVAYPNIRTLFAFIEPGQIDNTWVAVVIPHELVHLVFDTAVSNPYHFPPVWLNEGLATWLSEGYNPGDRELVEAAVADGTLMPLEALAGSFPRQGERIPLAYAEGASAVDFLVREHGRDAMVALVRAYADGVSDDEAFERAIGMDATAFAAEWLADLGAAEPVRYGPNPPPAGPLPPGWAGPGQTPAPTTPPSAVTPAPTPAASPGSGPTADDAGAGGMVLVAAVLAIAVIAGGVLLAVRRRSST